ncbi:MAG: membrane dipeptidase [Planctomycetota bacterium]|jgi:membrane dipeptidase
MLACEQGTTLGPMDTFHAALVITGLGAASALVAIPRPAPTSVTASGLARPTAPGTRQEAEPRSDITDEAARVIHQAILTLDTHKDISERLADPALKALAESGDANGQRLYQKNEPTLDGTSQVDFPKMRDGGLDAAFFIVYVGQGKLDDDGFALARKQAQAKFDAIHRMTERYPEEIALATSADEVEAADAAGKLIACIGIENGYCMGTDLDAIGEFHAMGARYMGLVHNRHSQLGDSHTPANAPLHGGLSELGRRAIEEMNRVGIMVDISHAAKTTTLQAIAHSKAPVIASHSGVDGVFDHGRNLSDEELMALKQNGGVLQCVAFRSYVRDDGGRLEFLVKTRKELGLPVGRGIQGAEQSPEMRAKSRELRDRMKAFDATSEPANVQDFVNHIDYAVEKIGIDYVGISSDFDGGGGVDGWNNARETINVTKELLKRGYTAEEIQKIWSGNTLRVWREVEAVAKQAAADASADASGEAGK